MPVLPSYRNQWIDLLYKSIDWFLYNPDHFVLNIGTNDLNSDRSPELIAKSIADVGSSLKNDSHDVSISSIIVRNNKVKEKAAQVNKNLEKLCVNASINCSILGSFCRKHLIIAHLNIDWFRNKFEFLVDQIKEKVNLLMVSETKLDESFPQGQFKIGGLVGHLDMIAITKQVVLCYLFAKIFQQNFTYWRILCGNSFKKAKVVDLLFLQP